MDLSFFAEADIENIKAINNRIETEEGRRIRIFIVPTFEHDNVSKPLASVLADLGFDVDLGSQKLSLEMQNRLVIENDVHVLWILTSQNKLKSAQNKLYKELVMQGYMCLVSYYKGTDMDVRFIVSESEQNKLETQTLNDVVKRLIYNIAGVSI